MAMQIVQRLLLMHLGISALMALASAAAARSGAVRPPSLDQPLQQGRLCHRVGQLSSALHRTPEERAVTRSADCCALELRVAEAMANLWSDMYLATPCRTDMEDWAMQSLGTTAHSPTPSAPTLPAWERGP